MARTKKKIDEENEIKDLDFTLPEEEADIVQVADSDGAEDDTTYTMGKIEVMGGAEEEEKLDLKKLNNGEDEEDVEWIDDGEIIKDDYDPYLDGADFDSDNPYNDDDLD